MNKNLKLLIGICLIVIGGLFILGLFNLISFNGIWLTLSYFWPLTISLIGILIILKTDQAKRIVIILFSTLLIASTVYFTINNSTTYYNNFNFDSGNNYNTFNFFDEY